jgi:hypothetical protein
MTSGTLRPPASGVHRSTTELERCINSHIDQVNAKPTPFIWSASGHDILAGIKPFNSSLPLCSKIFQKIRIGDTKSVC